MGEKHYEPVEVSLVPKDGRSHIRCKSFKYITYAYITTVEFSKKALRGHIRRFHKNKKLEAFAKDFKAELEQKSNQRSHSDREMFKHKGLSKLMLSRGGLGRCRICAEKSHGNSMEGLNEHVATRHAINILQYCALYFQGSNWDEVK